MRPHPHTLKHAVNEHYVTEYTPSKQEHLTFTDPIKDNCSRLPYQEH